MNSKKELLESIRPDMKLSYDFFRRIYGYEITWPGFAEKALTALAAIGCSKAWYYYNCAVTEADVRQERAYKEAGVWYVKEVERQFEELKRKRGEEQRKRTAKDYLQTMSDRELLKRLKKARS